MTQEIDSQPLGESRWRTLVHVITVQDLDDPRRARANLILPGWHARQHITLPLEKIPQELREQLGPDTYLLARVNLAAKGARKLHFSDFEAAPPPVPENEVYS